MSKRLLIIVFFLHSIRLCAQSDSLHLSKELDFLFYLIEQKQLDDFNYYGSQLMLNTSLKGTGLRDSVALVLADANNRFKDFKNAHLYYDEISEASPFIYYARFKSALFDIDEKKYDNAFAKAVSFNGVEDNLIHELTTYECSGIALLKRDFATYDSLSKDFLPSTGIIATEYQKLSANYELLRSTKKKSAFVAGCLSAVIPGLGKIYSGKKGQAFSAFMKVVPLGIIAFENMERHGVKDAQFIIYASLFSLFYIGNIWGSALSIQVAYQEKINEINHQITVGLHIPVERLFE